MRPQKKLSEDLEYFERYLATETVIKPKQVKKILHGLITKAKILEIKNKRINYVKGRGNISEPFKEGKSIR